MNLSEQRKSMGLLSYILQEGATGSSHQCLDAQAFFYTDSWHQRPRIANTIAFLVLTLSTNPMLESPQFSRKVFHNDPMSSWKSGRLAADGYSSTGRAKTSDPRRQSCFYDRRLYGALGILPTFQDIFSKLTPCFKSKKMPLVPPSETLSSVVFLEMPSHGEM